MVVDIVWEERQWPREARQSFPSASVNCLRAPTETMHSPIPPALGLLHRPREFGKPTSALDRNMMTCCRTLVAFMLVAIHKIDAFSISASVVRPRPFDLQATTPESVEETTDFPDVINGEPEKSVVETHWEDLENVTVSKKEMLSSAPHLSYDKFLTMQEKRVIVTIQYSEDAGLRPYYLTVAKKVKASHPDVLIERRILPSVGDESSEATFEVLVDGKVVIGKSKPRREKVARVDMSRARSVFVSMQELDINISRARRRRRPSTTYNGDDMPEQQPRKRSWND